MTKNVMGYEMLPDERELDCDKGHKPCMCAGRLECHNCGQPLHDDYEARTMTTLPCIWCDQTFTNKLSLANHFDNEHKGQL